MHPDEKAINICYKPKLGFSCPPGRDKLTPVKHYYISHLQMPFFQSRVSNFPYFSHALLISNGCQDAVCMRLMPQALPLQASINRAPDHSAFKDGSQTLLESPK